MLGECAVGLGFVFLSECIEDARSHEKLGGQAMADAVATGGVFIVGVDDGIVTEHRVLPFF